MILSSEFSLARERETDGEEALHCHTYALHWLTQSLATCRLRRRVVSKKPTIPWVKFRPLYIYYALLKSEHLEARDFFISSSKIWRLTALELLPSLVVNCESDLMSDILRFHAQVFKTQFSGSSLALLVSPLVNDVNTAGLLHLIPVLLCLSLVGLFYPPQKALWSLFCSLSAQRTFCTKSF